jgi:hypothetical protein
MIFTQLQFYSKSFFKAPKEIISLILSTNLIFSGASLARAPRRTIGRFFSLNSAMAALIVSTASLSDSTV